MQTNVIKQKGFHVEEDFYEEIINGLTSAQDREADRGKKQPIIVLPRQARYITTITAPLIAKPASGLIEKISKYHYKQQKDKKVFGLRAHFAESFRKFADLGKEVNDQIEEIADKGFNVLKIFGVIRRFRWIARLYHAIKMYKPDANPSFSVDLYKITNPVYFSELEGNFTELMASQQTALQGVFSGILTPVAKELFAMYDQKLEELYVTFWKYCFRNFIFDPESALDWTIFIVSFVAGVFTAGAGTTIYGIRLATKITNGVRKILIPLLKLADRIKTIKKIPAAEFFGKSIESVTRKVGDKIAADLTKSLSKSPSLKAAGKKGWNTYARTRDRLTTIRRVQLLFDFVDVTDQDVKDYHAYLKRRSEVWGRRFEASVSDDIGRMLNMSAEVFDLVSDNVKMAIDGVFKKTPEDVNQLDKYLSEKLRRDVSVTGFYDLEVVKMIHLLDVKFQLLWSKILISTGRLTKKIQDVPLFEMKVGDKIVFQDDSSVVFTFGDKKFDFNSKDKKISTKNGERKLNSISTEQQKNKDGVVKRESFRRIYSRGFATGFEVKINRSGIDKFKVIERQISSGGVHHGEIKVHEDGFITYNNGELYSNISDLFGNETVGFWEGNDVKQFKVGYGIISISRKIYECEKEAQNIISEINESILKALGGINVEEEIKGLESRQEHYKNNQSNSEKEEQERRIEQENQMFINLMMSH